MDVISWLRGKHAHEICNSQIEMLTKANFSYQFEVQELRKEITRWRTANDSMQKELQETINCLTRANQDVSMLENQSLESEEKALLAKARVEDLQNEIGYLKDQVKIYQTRLGLLPQEHQVEKRENLEPLRKARVPFAVAAARVQTQRTEEYWRNKAAQVEVDGVTGTTQESPTVSEERNAKE